MTSRRYLSSRVLIGCFVLAMTASPAFAGDDPPKPQGAAESAVTARPNLEVSLGGGVIVAPRPYEGASAAIIPIPVVNVRYKRLFAEGIRGGYQFLQSGQLTGNAYLQANFEGLESTDSAYLEGMANRRMSANSFFCEGR